MEEYSKLDPNDTHKHKLFNQQGVWFRHEGGEIKDKPKELREVLYGFTNTLDKNNTPEQNEKILLNFEYGMRTQFEGIYHQSIEYSTCICSYSRCGILNYITHKETQQTFAIGSHCIKKFMDPLFIKKLYQAKINGCCEICKIYKVVKKTKDFEKNCKSKEHKACIYCKIPFMEKQIKQLKDLLYVRDLLLEKKANTKLLDYENDNNMTALKIHFREKEYYKARYDIRWHMDLKLWFVNKSRLRHEEICNKIYLG